MGLEIYQAVKDFEVSPLRPISLQQIEDRASDKPAAEVGGANQSDSDLSSLFDWDDSMAN